MKRKDIPLLQKDVEAFFNLDTNQKFASKLVDEVVNGNVDYWCDIVEFMNALKKCFKIDDQKLILFLDAVDIYCFDKSGNVLMKWPKG